MLFLYTVVLSVVCVLGDNNNKYTSKYDNTNLEDIFNNERFYRAYFNCLIDQGPCTREGALLKEALPDGLQNGCDKCTEHQKQGTYQVLRYLYEKRPEDMSKLESIYDPEGVYRARYSDERDVILAEAKREN